MTMQIDDWEIVMPNAAEALEKLRFAATTDGAALTGEEFARTLRRFLRAHDADLLEQMLAALPRDGSSEWLPVEEIQALADRRRVGL